VDRGRSRRDFALLPGFRNKFPRQFSANGFVRRTNAGFHKIGIREYKNILIFS
jgi:hypothetical protein